jgi:hypothetical protein
MFEGGWIVLRLFDVFGGRLIMFVRGCRTEMDFVW